MVTMKTEFVTPTANQVLTCTHSKKSLWCRCALALAFAVAAGSTPAQTQTFTTLHDFTGPDGSYPNAGVFRDSAGNLYGTTYSGGAFGFGTVFKIDTSTNETVLYSFAGATDGANPVAGVVRDNAGNLYGTTPSGGSPICQCGTVFKVSNSGKETVLYRFRGGIDGAAPYAGVVRDSAGNLYGTTSSGGTSNNGTVFKVNASAKESVLYNFSGGVDGGGPTFGVIRDTVGDLYGVAPAGGAINAGVVFKLDVNNNETVLNDFSTSDAFGPSSDLIFCGTGADVCGVLNQGGATYEVNRKTGDLTLLGSTTGYPGGLEPFGGVVQDVAGNIYGTMSCCGQDFGTIFKMNTKGRYTVVYNFAGDADGGYPQGDLIMDAAGNLYGTTPNFGDPDCQCGSVYKFKP
jgi:uncharacterized repeat protein (TIGR03803 family)